MRKQELTIAVLFASLTWGQSSAVQELDRVLHFSDAPTPLAAREIINAIHSMAGDLQPTFDSAQNTIKLHGSAAQLGLAEWVFRELVQPEGSGTPECPVPGTGDVIRVFHLSRTTTPRDLQELINVIRGIGDVQRVFSVSEKRALLVRGMPAQADLAAFLLSALDKPAPEQASASQSGAPASFEYRTANFDPSAARAGGSVRILYLAHIGTPQGIVETNNLVRSIADLQRVYALEAQRALVMRGTEAQAQLAGWLVKQVDKPADWKGQGSVTYQYPDSFRGRGVVRVIYLARISMQQGPEEIVNYVSAAQQMPYIYALVAPPSVTVRGTAAEVDVAERLIRERDVAAIR